MGTPEPDQAQLPAIVRDARALTEEIGRVQSGLTDIARNFVARLNAELAAVQRRVVDVAAGRNPPRRVRSDLAEMIEIARSLQLKPNKGRRKDMKRVDGLVGELQGIVEKW
ncbi:MAG: hypothetical protein IT577_11605 [Verrucomicrobiae bacterium]|nr:hypothetical protein [Verrucomicrobiae bacterium]